METNTLKLFCFLVLLHVTNAVHQLDVVPTIVGVGLTRKLEVRCSFTRDPGSAITSLLSLQVAHAPQENNPQFSVLASINSNDYQVRGVILNTAAKTSGAFNTSGETFIKIVWTYPQKYNGGRYRCRATGINNMGATLNSIKGVIVKADAPNINSVVQEMGALAKNLDELQAKLAGGGVFQLNGINVTASLRSQFDVTEEYKGRRYYLNSQTHFFTATDAHFRCHMYGGYLAEIDDAEELEFIRTFLLAKNKFFEVLLGGSDEVEEGKWVYTYSGRPVKYFNWAPGQPNAGRGENNLCLWRDLRYLMSDCIALMNYSWSFLCEIPTGNAQ